MRRTTLLSLLLAFVAGPFGLGALDHHARHADPRPSGCDTRPEECPEDPGSEAPDAGGDRGDCAICAALHDAPPALSAAASLAPAALPDLRATEPPLGTPDVVPGPAPRGRAPPLFS